MELKRSESGSTTLSADLVAMQARFPAASEKCARHFVYFDCPLTILPCFVVPIFIWGVLSALLVVRTVCSELGLCLLQVLDGPEDAVASVLNHFFGLPVGRDDGVFADAHRGHLEGKQVQVWLHAGLSHLVGDRVEDTAVAQEAAGEAPEDHDFVVSDLHDAGTLSLSKLGRRHVDDDPGVGAVLRIVLFDRVAVLLAGLRDAAEDKDESVCEGARRVVVAAHVQVGDLEPQVQVDVVLLAALEGLVVFAPGASHDEELVVEAADCVAVAPVLHVVHRQTVEHIRFVVDDLEALLQRGRFALDVSAAHDKKLVRRRLDVREVVLERLLHVHLSPIDHFLRQVVLVHVLRVAFQHVD